MQLLTQLMILFGDKMKPQADGVNLSEPTILKNQKCPMCMKDTLTVYEYQTEVSHFGNAFLFSVECSNCGFKLSDVEFENSQNPVKWTFVVENEDDLRPLVVKSSQALVKLGNIMKMEPGIGSDGFITTVEGLILRGKEILQQLYDSEEDKDEKKKIWDSIKKLNKVLWGDAKLKITIEDPYGNSAIVSDKAKKEALKVKKR